MENEKNCSLNIIMKKMILRFIQNIIKKRQTSLKLACCTITHIKKSKNM